MKKIGVLSDTHGYIDKQIIDFFQGCDEIWHAGDIGNKAVLDRLKHQFIIRAVYGNIDGTDFRAEYPEHERFLCEDLDVWMTHIGGYPDRYDIRVRKNIRENPPGLFICGHSHILKVIYDKKLKLLHINPGAAGKSGFHRVRTVVRFAVDGNHLDGLEVLEMKR